MNRSSLLRWLNSGYIRVTSAYRTAGIALGVGSVVLVAATYGGAVMRIFLGEEAFSIYFGNSVRDWMFHCIDFVYVPISLLLSDSLLFDTIILITTPVFFVNNGRTVQGILDGSASSSSLFRFPPSPAVTLMALPYIKVLYNALWSTVSKFLTGKDLGGSFGQLRRDVEILRVQRDEVVGQQDNIDNEIANIAALQNIDEHPAGDLPPPPAPAPQANAPAPPPAANNNNNNFNLARVGVGLLARSLLSSLLAPLMGQMVGSLLHQWSLASSLPGSHLMQKVLGTGRVGRIGSRPGSGVWIRQRIGFGPVIPLGLQLGLEDLDPVWWRNAVGLAAYVVVTDAVGLLHLWLVLRERKHRKIVDRSFAGFDYSSLDLITE